jgi:hypothetical protein
MPYTRSRARKLFESDLASIVLTIRAAYSGQCLSGPVREFALCSAVLLCSAKIESYLEDLLADWARAVMAQGVTTERLPRTTRAFLMNQQALGAAYRRFIADEDEIALLGRLEALIGATAFEFAFDGRQLPRFSVPSLYSDRKYPSPKNLKRLFARFGIAHVFNAMDRVARRDTEALLKSFNDLRTEMAHVGMPVGLSDVDIKKHLVNVQVIVRSMDRMFFQHVTKTVGSNCWTS